VFRFLGGKKQARSDWAVISTVLKAEPRLRGAGNMSARRFAGVVFRPADVPVLNDLDSQVREALYQGEGATRTAFRVEDDPHGTRWVVLEDGAFDDLVSSTYTVGRMIEANDAGEHLLAAVFGVRATPPAPGPGESRRSPVAYWIYTYRRKRYYPFVPTDESERDRLLEMEMAREMRRAGMDVDPSLEDWFGLWGIPF